MEASDQRINRNILECKWAIVKLAATPLFFVLIETYWNVNDGRLQRPELLSAY